MASYELSQSEIQASRLEAENRLNIMSLRFRINELAEKICQALDERAAQTGISYSQMEYDLPKEQARITHAVPRDSNGVTYVSDDAYLSMLTATWRRLTIQNNKLRHQIGDFNFHTHFGDHTKG